MWFFKAVWWYSRNFLGKRVLYLDWDRKNVIQLLKFLLGFVFCSLFSNWNWLRKLSNQDEPSWFTRLRSAGGALLSAPPKHLWIPILYIRLTQGVVSTCSACSHANCIDVPLENVRPSIVNTMLRSGQCVSPATFIAPRKTLFETRHFCLMSHSVNIPFEEWHYWTVIQLFYCSKGFNTILKDLSCSIKTQDREGCHVMRCWFPKNY